MTDATEGDEERFEVLQIIVKSKPEGESWFDTIVDMISEDCQGSEIEPCTCGLESAGGSSGSLDQCYRYIGIDDDKVTVNKADVMLLMTQLAKSGYEKALPGLPEALVRLNYECTWWEDFLARIPDEEDDGSETELLP